MARAGGTPAERSVRLRVLIVDDAATERAILTRLLGAAGHVAVGEVGSLPEALALLDSTAPDCAIVDGRLPGGGVAAIRALRAASAGLRLVVIASLEEIPLVRATAAAGSHGAIRRPLLAREVAGTLREVEAGT